MKPTGIHWAKCIHCRGVMPPDSMLITVRDSVKNSIKLADLCSYRCIIDWASPMARTLETADGRRRGDMNTIWPDPMGQTA